MNLHDLISSDQPFIGPCCSHFPIGYKVTYGKTPVLTVRWENIKPLDVLCLQQMDGKIYGLRINTLHDPVQTLSLLDCFQQIIDNDGKYGCSSNSYIYSIFCHARGIYLEIYSLMPMNIQLLEGDDIGSGGFRIRFESLDDFKDFKNLLAGILYWPIIQKTGWVR